MNFTKNGQFTVKSVYHLHMTNNRVKTGRPKPSSTVANYKGWLALWDTCALNKAKIHTRHLIRNGLAIGAELHHRRVDEGIFCVVCGREETIYHRFWACPHLMMF